MSETVVDMKKNQLNTINVWKQKSYTFEFLYSYSHFLPSSIVDNKFLTCADGFDHVEIFQLEVHNFVLAV